MQGLHLTADLRDCARDIGRGAGAGGVMSEAAALRAACLAAVHACGLQPVGELFHPFARAADAPDAPAGVTGVVLLAESHLAVHTWPERDAVTLDVYVCNVGADNSARARALLGALIDAFAPAQVERHELQRGALLTGAPPTGASTSARTGAHAEESPSRR